MSIRYLRVDEDSGQLHIAFGGSAKTSDFIADSLYGWWEQLSATDKNEFSILQIKADNGSESNGRRTQFLKRMVAVAVAVAVEFADHTGKTIQLLYYPPYHKIQSRRTVLGHLGKALERHAIGRCMKPCWSGRKA